MLLAAVIWGFAFVAQRVGMEHIGPFSYNGIRFLLGALSLLPLLLLNRRSTVLADADEGGRWLWIGVAVCWQDCCCLQVLHCSKWVSSIPPRARPALLPGYMW